MRQPLWADLHNHNGIGYGRGSLERSYAIARGVLLDVYCFTPHGLWHDMPADDPKIVDFHKEGFELVRRNWDDIRKKANAENVDGEFTAFLGFEWHSSCFGDYHVIFPGGEGEICAAGSLAELQEFVRARGAIMIPHHVAYPSGWRGADWTGFDPELSPVVEVFSEHGSSMEADSHMAMTGHSMGGAERSQTVGAQLEHGLVAGLVGSTDNHWGHPASFGEGLAAIRAEGTTRAAVFEALRRRHTYAVTGDRIGLDVAMAGGTMGDLLPASSERRLRCEVDALGALDFVRVIRNGRAVHSVPPPVPVPGKDEKSFTIRLEFGWDAMTSEEVTDWKIVTRVNGGHLARVAPCLAGGGGSVEKINRVVLASESEVRVEAYTSRKNSRPTGGVALRVEGDAATEIDVEVEAVYRGKACGCRLSSSIERLLAVDEWAAVSEIFSAPKVRLGGAYGASETGLAFEWTDPEPGPDDWYMVEVRQKNGQSAWSSPIRCRS